MASPDNFPAAWAFLLVSEGTTYTNDPLDRGGPTKYGVTLATLAVYRALKKLPAPTAADVKALTAEGAGDVYRLLYWPKTGGDALADSAVATVLFDSGVLNGTSTVGQIAQRVAVGLSGIALVADGALGPKTCAAINACPRRPFLLAVKAALEDRYLKICDADPSQLKWLDGWAARSARYLKLAK